MERVSSTRAMVDTSMEDAAMADRVTGLVEIGWSLTRNVNESTSRMSSAQQYKVHGSLRLVAAALRLSSHCCSSLEFPFLETPWPR
jgi:hypothetical protein